MLNAPTGVYIGQPVAPEFARSTHALNHAIGLPGTPRGSAQGKGAGEPAEKSVIGTAIEYTLSKAKGSPQAGQSDTGGWPDVFTGLADYRRGCRMIASYCPTATTSLG